jgi:hypothetical protein
MQVLPQALPALHTLQHWSAGMHVRGVAVSVDASRGTRRSSWAWVAGLQVIRAARQSRAPRGRFREGGLDCMTDERITARDGLRIVLLPVTHSANASTRVERIPQAKRS